MSNQDDVDEVAPKLPSSLRQTETAVQPDSQQVRESDRVRLSEGKALTAREALPITSRHRARVVVVGGMPKSGKTTLLASLYSRFLLGSFDDFCFAGSRTLYEFEEICFLARNSSGRVRADTARTPSAESRFLHLALATQPARSIDLLFSDLSGEIFRQLRVDREYARSLAVIERADQFTLLIDGDKLATDERHVAANDARAILQQCVSTGLLGREVPLDVRVSKWDRLVARLGEAEAHRRADAAYDVLASVLDGFHQFECGVLSVRDDEGELAHDPEPLRRLLVHWATAAPATSPAPPSITRDNTNRELPPYLRFGMGAGV